MTELLTTRQVQALLQVDRTTIYRMVEGGHLPAVRVGKQWRFVRTEVELWLRKHAPNEAAAPVARPEGGRSRHESYAGLESSGGAGDLHSLLPTACTQMIQDAFAEALGVMIIVTDMQGRPVTNISNPCGFFTVLTAGNPAAVEQCVQTWEALASHIALEPKFVASEMGLLCARGLIRMGTELKGMVVIGGIAPETWPPSAEQARSLARAFGIEPSTVSSGADAVYHMDRANQERALRFVQRIADIFSNMVQDHAKQGSARVV